MLDSLNKPTTGIDALLTTQATPRVRRLREAFLDTKPTVSIDRARIEMRVLKETEGEATVTRRARVFTAAARETPVHIYPDELLLGYANVKQRAMSIGPADGPAVESGEDSICIYGSRGTGFDDYDLTSLTEEEQRVLRDELVPHWKGRGQYESTLPGRNCQQVPAELRDYFFEDPTVYPPRPTMTPQLLGRQHYGHNVVGYDKVIRKGFHGIRAEAEERLSRIDYADPNQLRKVPFLKGVVLALEAAAEVGQRFAAEAREQAHREADRKRRDELLEIAGVCDRVPAHPARTFHEALQSCYFAWILLIWEHPTVSAVSPGRMDQYLSPSYSRDIENGRLTRERAQELIDCFLIKMNNATGSSAVTVGGLKPNGKDATNELSYMLIEGMMHTRLRLPYFSVQVHNRMPDDLLIKGCRLCALGTGHPQFLNSDVIVAQALARGDSGGPPVTLTDARSAAPIGCSEVGIPGKDSGYLFIDQPNLATAMELVMTNGVRRSDKRRIGVETGDPRQFRSFDEVREAYRKQVAWIRRNCQIAGTIRERSIIDLYPTPYESALIEGCIEKGMSREEGGAHYNFNVGGGELGSTDAGDSLMAIKKLVFQDGVITMDQLCDALERDFQGHEQLHQMLLDAPKFGNDDAAADEQKAWVLHQWVTEFRKIKNLRGGYASPGGSIMWSYVPAGKGVGALPSGRKARDPLADAASPSSGQDVKGPTAVLKSMGKVDNVEILGGVILNMRIDPAVFKGGDVRPLADLIRVFIDQKIFHVQFNVVSTDTLKAAQEAPEKHRDLMVKVAGYNTLFTLLSRPLQDSIIARTTHTLQT